ncbi:MAG: sigma-70 family RNA polymerase sigma factor [Bacteroidales bacterium]|jgi:RNA polymerase sigma factor (sigma-70 family)|nr:sigma-70 family RNA polymerase sigma factor [Bacteroidales bacterium]
MKNRTETYNNIHQDIINKCKIGDQKAQFQLYKLYYKSMYNTSLRIVNNNQLAEDIMQESFLKAFEKISNYIGKVSFGAWLKKIVINKSLDEIKIQKIKTDTIDDNLSNKIYEKVNTQDFNYELKAEQIKSAMELLPDGYRIVLSLNLIEGYDHNEISHILKITSSTSRSQCTRAKKKLIAILKPKLLLKK